MTRAGKSKVIISAAILAGLICIGAYFRCDHLGKQSLWVDEYWALYLATGRGNLIFNMPLNTVIWSPPAVGFSGAPPWWHIWTGLASTPHPPLYHLALRFWVDLFGDSDLAVRSMSATLGLGCVALIFDLVRRSYGTFAALAAAAIMALADIQIDFAQQVRPYTMVVFIALVVCEAVIIIEQRGLSAVRIGLLGISVLCLALTHYFALGAIGGVGVYALIRYTGRRRWAVFSAIAGAILVAAIAWGPFAWSTRHSYIMGPHFAEFPGQSVWKAVIEAPSRLVASGAESRLLTYALALLVYVLPLLKMRQDPRLLLWWLWTVCAIGLVATIDLARGSELVSMGRYIVVASPGVYIILATSFQRGLGRCIPLAVVAAAAAFGVVRWRTGSDYVRHTAAVAQLIHDKIGPRDGVVITGHFDSDPAFRYFVIAHYGGDWKNAIVLLTKPASAKLSQQLSALPNVWVVGYDGSDMRLMPGWKAEEFQGVEPGFCVWKIVRSPT